MKNIYIFMAVFLLFAGLRQGYAQGSKACADTRIRKGARVALTTPAQQKLMNKYDVSFYKLDVSLERTSTFIAGNARIQATSKVAALDTFAFELHQDLQVDSVFLNGQKRAFTRQSGLVYVKPAVPFANGTLFNALIYYKGLPPAGGSAAIGEGMSNGFSPSWGNQVTWSLSQPFSAYEWFPVKQVLTDKADSSEVWITTSAANKAGSNGLLKNISTLPNGKKRYEWKSRYPIDYYLISVAVAEYVDYTIFATVPGVASPIPIQNYIYNNPATLVRFQADINDTAPLLVTFSNLFGTYPFSREKYGHCMAPLSGGMEHQTMTTQGFFEFTLTAHELGHQWFGDNVTCASWRDIWLNEGFASYCEYLALENMRSGQERTWMNNAHTPVLNQSGGSVYIPAADSTNVNRIFSSTFTYNKGAAVLHMLRFTMNNDLQFFNTLKAWQNQFKNGTGKTQDFKQVAETISGKNLTTFFNQWIYGEGFPTFSLAWNQVGNNLTFRVTETVSKSSVTPFFQTDVEYRIRTNLGDTIVRVPQNQSVQFYTIPVRGQVNSLEVDPNQWILNQQGLVVRDINLVNSTTDPVNAVPLVLFPNPARDQIQISGLNFTPQKIRIMDVTGRIVQTENTSLLTDSKIWISHLPAGIYTVQLVGRDQVISRVFRKE